MKPLLTGRKFLLAVLLCLACELLVAAADPDEQLDHISKRAPWTTSRVKGSPEPPLPYRAKRIFPHLGFEQPTVLTGAPGTDRLFVAEQRGRIYSIPNVRDCRKADLLLDVNELVKRFNARLQRKDQVALEAVYGLTFHPDFASNRKFYVCYVVRYLDRKRGQHPNGTRVVELKADDNDPPQAKLSSEVEIIAWLQGGHNGGCIKFGHDGMLYVSTGDGGFAFPPDGRNSGQDVSNLLSAVLRIDVDNPTDDRAYSIPKDNPFVALKEARGEIWAYGMRNPWKISFDRRTGDLWVGDVGWELWELVYRVKAGDNYGWSLVEGHQPVHTERQRGPTPIVPPVVEIPHTEGASITGGFVYRGKRFPELVGYYIFGDWETRRFWGVPVDGEAIGPRKELIEPTVRIVGFAERHDGELLLLDYDDGSIHELVRNEEAGRLGDHPATSQFPRRLSETGLFDSVAKHTPAAGVVPFSINAAQWSDHATAERWLGLPGESSIVLHERPERVAGSMFSRTMDYPKDAVLMKTLSLELVRGDPESSRRIETQLLHFNGYDWRGYSYRWNKEQTDAELVEAAGDSATFDVKDAAAHSGTRRQTWRFHSRMECSRCHNPWAEFSLAFNVPQLNRLEGQSGLNQLEKLYQMGVLRHAPAQLYPGDPFAVIEQPKPLDQRPRLVNPRDESVSLRDRARSYIHVNCAHCHRFNGGGAARIHMPFDTPIYKTEAVATRPTQGTFGIHDAKIIAPGDPYRSVLYFRMMKSGPGHMPHLGSKIIDRRGAALIHDWIHQLPPDIELAERVDTLIGLDEPAVLAHEKKAAALTRWKLAKGIAGRDNREVPTQADMDAAAIQAKAEARQRANSRDERRTMLVQQLMSTPRGAVFLARAQQRKQLPATISNLVLEAAARHENTAVRDLFDPYLPEDLKTRRLGDSINREELLQLAGDAERGKDLFLNSNAIQCVNCHRVGQQGKQLGPDLTHIGRKLSREKLLESVLEPSRTIDPKFAGWLIETTSGKVVSGLLVKKTDKEVVLLDTQNKKHRLAANEIEAMFPQRKSLMPELLLRDMTAQQAADLLSWLESLK